MSNYDNLVAHMPYSGVWTFGLRMQVSVPSWSFLWKDSMKIETIQGSFQPIPVSCKLCIAQKLQEGSSFGWVYVARLFLASSIIHFCLAQCLELQQNLLHLLLCNQNYAWTLSLGILLCLDSNLENGKAIRHLPPILFLTSFPYKNTTLCVVFQL